MGEEFGQIVKVIADTFASNYGSRIDRLESDVKDLTKKSEESGNLQTEIKTKLDSVMKLQEELKTKIELVIQAPSRRWDALVSVALGSCVTGVIGFVIGKLIK